MVDKDPDGTDWRVLSTRDGYWVDLAMSPTGRLFGLDETRSLQEIDLKTGETRYIGATGLATVNGFEIDAVGHAYVSDKDGGFYNVDLRTGGVDRVGSTAGSAGDIAYVRGDLWMSTKTNMLVKIDPLTGKSSSGFAHGVFNVTAMTNTDSDGFVAYAKNTVYQVDVETGSLTKIGRLDGVSYVLGGASLPTQYYLSKDVPDAAVSGRYDVVIFGNSLGNHIEGNSGANRLYGSAGDDVIAGAGGKDALFGNRGNDRLSGGDDNDYLSDGKGAGRLFGGRGDDKLRGGSNNDWLKGGPGNDDLRGGSGADVLTGGAGQDVMLGGSGADEFRFASVDDTPYGTNLDIILDFTLGLDLIDLSGIDAREGTGSDDGFRFIGEKAFSGHAGELRYDGVLMGDVDGNGKPDFGLTLDNVVKLTADDLIL